MIARLSILLGLFALTGCSGSPSNNGRYQILSLPVVEEVYLVVKLDTRTGQTWQFSKGTWYPHKTISP